MYRVLVDAYKAGDRELFKLSSDRFLRLILMQDRLLATRPEFKVGRWLESARNLGSTEEEKDWYEWNARVQITTWGTGLLQMMAVCMIMLTENGTDCCATSIICAGRLGWMNN